MKTFLRGKIKELKINTESVRALCEDHGWFLTGAERIQDVACPQCPAVAKRIGRPPIVTETVVVARVPLGLLVERTTRTADVWAHETARELRTRVTVECCRTFTARGVAAAVVTALRSAYGSDPLPLEALDVARALLEVTPDLPPAKRPVGRPRVIKKAPEGA